MVQPAPRSLLQSFTGGCSGWRDGRAPAEVIVLRCIGVVYLTVFMIATATAKPGPGLGGRGAAILVALIGFVAAALTTQSRSDMPDGRRIAALIAMTGFSAVLAIAQPDGLWQSGPYFVGIVAASRLERRSAALTIGLSLTVLAAVAVASDHASSAISVVVGVVPWFLVMRLVRATREQHLVLEASQAAEASAAAAAERGRLAREMHDVLAHSLSALALLLESTRLLARDRGADQRLTRALDQAHHLAVGGLEEARSAIATARGDELPGPERLNALAAAFRELSGLPVAIGVQGDPRELTPEARLAVYRTAQEALTNVRRHAAADRVEVQLNYQAASTVLVVEDHAPAGAPPPVALELTDNRQGYGLTGMRERAELLGDELLAHATRDGFRVELRLPE